MRILVIGGYGLIGLEIIRALMSVEHDVVGLGRSKRTGGRAAPSAEWITADMRALLAPSDWAPILANIDIVVNAAGALQDGPRDNLRAVQETAVIALIKACERAGVQRFIQISAPGATLHASTNFMRTKAKADAVLKDSALDWIILRPGLVIGRSAYGGSALLRMLAALPLIEVLVYADSKIQTVSLDEVADAAARAAAGALPARTDIDLVEDEPHTLAEIAALFRQWIGAPPPRIQLRLPGAIGALVGRLADLAGLLGWRSPLRTNALKALREDVLGDPAPWRGLGRPPFSGLAKTLEAMPSTVQERWFARAALLAPFLILTLAGFWIASGVIGLMRQEEAAAVAMQAGLPRSLAEAAVLLGAGVDIALGGAVLIRPAVKPTCYAMIAVTAFYLAAATIGAPALWLDPLGPLVKTIPAAMLALAASLFVDQR